MQRKQRRRQNSRRRSLAEPLRPDFLMAAAVFLTFAVFCGGPVGWTPAYMLATLVVIASAATLAWWDGFGTVRALPAVARSGLIGIAALPLLQLVPLPPGLWQQLPGQELRIGTLSLAGLADSWQPLSVEPASTALVALMAVGFVVLTVLLLRLDDRAFRRMLIVAVGVVAAGIAVGLLQVVSGGAPHLQIGRSSPNMLGFLANKNHMALVIACGIVLAGLIVAPELLGVRRSRVAVGAATAFALVCIVTTNSRAGLALGGLAAAVVLFHSFRTVALRWRLAALTILLVLVAVIISSDVFRVVSGRVGDVDDDLRWSFLTWSWPLVEQYWVLGSGFGSFVTLFAAHEQLAWVKPTFVNAVHNDYVQLLLEGGLPGVLVLGSVLYATVNTALAARALVPGDPRRMEAVAGVMILLLFALHSALDYPLRRPAAAAFVALALAAILRSALPRLTVKGDPA